MEVRTVWRTSMNRELCDMAAPQARWSALLEMLTRDGRVEYDTTVFDTVLPELLVVRG